MSDFEQARDDLREQILSTFGYLMEVTDPEGVSRSITASVKAKERDGVTVHTLITDVVLIPLSIVVYHHQTYTITSGAPAQGRNTSQQSQIIREYPMNLKQAGEQNGWSEYPNGD